MSISVNFGNSQPLKPVEPKKELKKVLQPEQPETQKDTLVVNGKEVKPNAKQIDKVLNDKPAPKLNVKA